MFLLVKKKIQNLIKRKRQKRGDQKNKDFSIGLFQIENLIHNNVSFLFFNLSESYQLNNKRIADVYQRAEKIHQSLVEKRLYQENRSVPVVLICENGIQSRELAIKLQEKGFINVFFLEGGIGSYKD